MRSIRPSVVDVISSLPWVLLLLGPGQAANVIHREDNMLFSVHRYVDRYGISHKFIDRTRGIPLVVDTIALLLRDLREKVRYAAKCVLPAKNASGTYVYRNGKMVKISRDARVIDAWMKKYGFTWDQGLRERHNMFVDMANRGKLFEVDDREVWEKSMKMYGRDKVWTGSAKETRFKN